MAGALGGVRASALVTRVREAADMEVTQSGSSQFASDKEIRRRIDEAAAALYDKLIAAIGEDYFVKVVHLQHEAYTEKNQVFLPRDFYRLVSVHTEKQRPETDPSGESVWYDVRPVEPFQRAEMTALLNREPADEGPFFYRLRGLRERYDGLPNPFSQLTDFLEVYPKRVTTGWLRVSYIPRHAAHDDPEPNVNDPDNPIVDPDPVYAGINGWEEWIVLKVAIRLLAKEESDTSDLRADLAEVEARIAAAAGRRDESRPERMLDLKYGSADRAAHLRGRWYP